MLLEVCIDRVESAKNAEKGGAGRVEVRISFSSLNSSSVIILSMEVPLLVLEWFVIITNKVLCVEVVKNSISIPVNVIIRPRGGDFYYNEDEVFDFLTVYVRWTLCWKIYVLANVLESSMICLNNF